MDLFALDALEAPLVLAGVGVVMGAASPSSSESSAPKGLCVAWRARTRYGGDGRSVRCGGVELSENPESVGGCGQQQQQCVVVMSGVLGKNKNAR